MIEVLQVIKRHRSEISGARRFTFPRHFIAAYSILRALKGRIRSPHLAALTILLMFLSVSPTASAIPAFARKFGMPCSACHEAWPKLNNFGQTFKDSGYQIGNDRDSPIYVQPAYWPIALRITPQWHSELGTAQPVDGSASGVQTVLSQGFDLSGMDMLTGGTLSKNISFLLTPSSDVFASFHFESAWVRFDNLLKTPWLNVKMGKFELDNVISEKRILTLSQNGGLYQTYHYLPFVDANAFLAAPGAPGEQGVRSTTFGIGDNQLGIELMGHSRSSYTRYSASVLSSSDGEVAQPTSRSYDAFLAGSQAFNVGSLGVQRVGVFSYLGQSPTRILTSGNAPIPGTGYGNKGFTRTGVYALFYLRRLDFVPMFTHGSESAFLTLGIPSDQTLPIGTRNPGWNARMLETNYTLNPQFIVTGRYEDIRNSRQLFTSSRGNFGDLDAETVSIRWYPFMNSRDGLALHSEYSKVHTTGTSAIGGNQTTSSGLFGLDFIF